MDRFYLSLVSAEKYGNELVFWALNANRLLSYNVITKEIIMLSDGECHYEYDMKVPLLYNSSVKIGKIAYFAPFNSKSICMYNFETKVVGFIPIGNKGLCSGIFMFGDDIYLWGWGKNNVKKVETNYHHIHKVRCLEGIVITSNPVYIENSIFFTIDEVDTICEFDMGLETCKKHRVGSKENRYNTILYEDGKIWLSGDKEVIVLWDIKNKAVKEISLANKVSVQTNSWVNSLFSNSKVVGQYIYYSPYKSNDLIRINIKNKDIEIVKSFKEATGGFFIEMDTTRVCLIIEVYSHHASNNVIIDVCGNIKEEAIFYVSMKSAIAREAPIIDINENKIDNLDRFIRSIVAIR